MARSSLSLDREIPWRQIVDSKQSVIDEFTKAMDKKAGAFRKWSPLQPLSHTEVARVRSRPHLRRRVLKARVAYRDKSCGIGSLRAKALVVIKGFLDPDLAKLTRFSPTVTRTSVMILL